MKVRHDAGSLKEGESVVMTLSDQQMLDKDGNLIDAPDELSNVRMTDAERAKHHEALKNQKEYDPTKEGQDILDKYDDLKTGLPSGFVIGGRSVGGVIEENDPEKKLAILTALSEKTSLESKFKVQSDYYTNDEMAKFRKPPKKKTKRRKGTDAKDKEDQIGDSTQAENNNAVRPVDAGSDEEDPELYEQLSKQRRLVKRSDAGATKRGEAALSAVSDRISSVEDKDEETKKEEPEVQGAKAKEGDQIAMTATTEFCNVVQTPLEKMDTVKHESFRGSTLYKQQATQRKGIAAGERKARKAGMARNEEETAAPMTLEDETIENLMEDGLDLSCASGLAFLRWELLATATRMSSPLWRMLWSRAHTCRTAPCSLISSRAELNSAKEDKTAWRMVILSTCCCRVPCTCKSDSRDKPFKSSSEISLPISMNDSSANGSVSSSPAESISVSSPLEKPCG